MAEHESQARAADQLAGSLLGDVGYRRLIDFQALGVRWTFQSDNNRETVLTAEGFVAVPQVLLVDTAPMNPVLIKSTIWVAVNVRLGASREDDSIGIDDSGPKVLTSVALSSSLTDPEVHNKAILAIYCQLPHVVHVRPPDELQDLLEPLFRDGFIHEVSIGRPYGEITALLDDNRYALCADVSELSSSNAFQPTECEHSPASIVTGPDCGRDEPLQAIRERYEVANKALRFTLPRLLSDQTGRATIVRLRNDGWLSW